MGQWPTCTVGSRDYCYAPLGINPSFSIHTVSTLHTFSVAIPDCQLYHVILWYKSAILSKHCHSHICTLSISFTLNLWCQLSSERLSFILLLAHSMFASPLLLPSYVCLPKFLLHPNVCHFHLFPWAKKHQWVCSQATLSSAIMNFLCVLFMRIYIPIAKVNLLQWYLYWLLLSCVDLIFLGHFLWVSCISCQSETVKILEVKVAQVFW